MIFRSNLFHSQDHQVLNLPKWIQKGTITFILSDLRFFWLMMNTSCELNHHINAATDKKKTAFWVKLVFVYMFKLLTVTKHFPFDINLPFRIVIKMQMSACWELVFFKLKSDTIPIWGETSTRLWFDYCPGLELVSASFMGSCQHPKVPLPKNLSPPAGVITPTPPWVDEGHSSLISSSANRDRYSLQANFLSSVLYLLAVGQSYLTT